jgi:hypothetical protein
MVNSDRPLFYPYFWRTVNYLLLFGLPFVWLICLYPLRVDALTTILLWSLIIFFGEFLVFNLLLANADELKFKEWITSRVFSLVLSGSLIVMLLIVAIVKLFR